MFGLSDFSRRSLSFSATGIGSPEATWYRRLSRRHWGFPSRKKERSETRETLNNFRFPREGENREPEPAEHPPSPKQSPSPTHASIQPKHSETTQAPNLDESGSSDRRTLYHDAPEEPLSDSTSPGRQPLNDSDESRDGIDLSHLDFASDRPQEELATPAPPNESTEMSPSQHRPSVQIGQAPHPLRQRQYQSEVPVSKTTRKIPNGTVAKAERMFVNVFECSEDLPRFFNESFGIGTAVKAKNKWSEYVVVCRRMETEHYQYVLEFYTRRDIPRNSLSKKKRKPVFNVHLVQDYTQLNLFSSLDKSFVIWHPQEKGTRFVVLRPRSVLHSLEWFSYLRKILGWKLPKQLIINVPDLNVKLSVSHPLQDGSSKEESAVGSHGSFSTAGVPKLNPYGAYDNAASDQIVDACMASLREAFQWGDVLDSWPHYKNLGLAWRRYDRLEWIRGGNRRDMDGTVAMNLSHQLELRPRIHYPTIAPLDSGEQLHEPPPVEGFLILLTSQVGGYLRFGKPFSQRLYCSVHDQFLCLTRPPQACPPKSPHMPATESRGSYRTPSTTRLQGEMPLVYDFTPFSLDDDGNISWLQPSGQFSIRANDDRAYQEYCRNLRNLQSAEGFFDLTKVARVKPARFKKEHLWFGGKVFGDSPSYDASDDHNGSAHSGSEYDSSKNEACYFDIILENGLRTRFRTYNQISRDHWVECLGALSRYWKARKIDDNRQLRKVRRRNLECLRIDEAREAIFGEYAQKWEASMADSSPEVFSICRISGCRSIKMSGALYCKPRHYANFEQNFFILAGGRLLAYQMTMRRMSGTPIPLTYNSRKSSLDIDLRNCYVYSGILTDANLLYGDTTFNPNKPQPRTAAHIYRSDNWVSADDDKSVTFVIWINQRHTLTLSERDGLDEYDYWESGDRLDDDRDGSANASENERGSENSNGNPNYQPQTRRAKLKKKTIQWRKKKRQHKTGDAASLPKFMTALGVSGRAVVFRARSRVDRDSWVLSLQTEIDRLHQRLDEDE